MAGGKRRPPGRRRPVDGALWRARTVIGVVAADRTTGSDGSRPSAAVAGSRPFARVAGLPPSALAGCRPLAGTAPMAAGRGLGGAPPWGPRFRTAAGPWAEAPVVPRQAPSGRWVDRAAPARSRRVRAAPEKPQATLWRRYWAGWVRRVLVPLEGLTGVWPAEPRVSWWRPGHQRRVASRPGSPATASARTAPSGGRRRPPHRPAPQWASAVGRAARSGPRRVGRGRRGRRVPPGGAPRARRARRWRRGCSCGGPRAGCPALRLPRRARKRARAAPGRSAPTAVRPRRTPPPTPGGRRADRPPRGAAAPAGARCAAPPGDHRCTEGEGSRQPPRAAAGRR
ncbi:hypothetical protein FBZ33_4131 [Micromonospora sp. A202]|nr:hypothetical protein FBZ33_4131 [Micromonospora sp. A202]